MTYGDKVMVVLSKPLWGPLAQTCDLDTLGSYSVVLDLLLITFGLLYRAADLGQSSNTELGGAPTALSGRMQS